MDRPAPISIALVNDSRCSRLLGELLLPPGVLELNRNRPGAARRILRSQATGG